MPLQIVSPLHKATRQIGLALEESCQGLGVSPVEGHLLSFLNSYAPCPIGELLRVFGHKRSTLTSLLDRLEEHGFVVRQPHPEDRRSFLVSLTPAGGQLAARLNEILEELERRILDELSPRQVAGFRATLDAIAAVTRVTVRREEKP